MDFWCASSGCGQSLWQGIRRSTGQGKMSMPKGNRKPSHFRCGGFILRAGLSELFNPCLKTAASLMIRP